MHESRRWRCRDCAYELTALPGVERCPECGGRQRVDSVRKVRARIPWWVRLWPVYVGVLSALPMILFSGVSLIDDSVAGIVLTLMHWLPPFVLLAVVGWVGPAIPRAGVRVGSQLAGVVAVVLFPGLWISNEIVNPTDALSVFVLGAMPTLGTVIAGLVALAGAAIARADAR